MGTQLSNQAEAVMEAMEEARVDTVICLYEAGMFDALTTSRDKRKDIFRILSVLKMNPETAKFWLDYFKIL